MKRQTYDEEHTAHATTTPIGAIRAEPVLHVHRCVLFFVVVLLLSYCDMCKFSTNEYFEIETLVIFSVCFRFFTNKTLTNQSHLKMEHWVHDAAKVFT